MNQMITGKKMRTIVLKGIKTSLFQTVIDFTFFKNFQIYGLIKSKFNYMLMLKKNFKMNFLELILREFL